MPFTLYHLGPALLVGLPLRRRIDLTTLCIASVVLDIRPALVLFGVLPGPYHWVEHTYLGAAVVTGVLIVGMVLGARRFPTRFDRWRTDGGGLTGLVIPGLIGTLLHVTLDSYPSDNGSVHSDRWQSILSTFHAYGIDRYLCYSLIHRSCVACAALYGENALHSITNVVRHGCKSAVCDRASANNQHLPQTPVNWS